MRKVNKSTLGERVSAVFAELGEKLIDPESRERYMLSRAAEDYEITKHNIEMEMKQRAASQKYEHCRYRG